MAAAAQQLGDAADVDLVRDGAGHKLDMVSHINQDKKAIRLVKLSQASGQDTNLFNIVINLGQANQNCVTVDQPCFQVFNNLVVKRLLGLGDGLVELSADQIEVGLAFAEQPGGRMQIARSGIAVSKSPGIFINTEQ